MARYCPCQNTRRANSSHAYKLSCTHAKYRRVKRRQARTSRKANRRG